MQYFAYGSNLFTTRLRERVPHASFVSIARLHGHALKFHKRSDDGSGKCNVLESPGSMVIGVIFDVPANEKANLDRAEGLGHGYEEREFELCTPTGSSRNVLAYVAEVAYIDDSLRPYGWYREYVLRGAREHNFWRAYIDSIVTIEASRDPDRRREARKLKLLGVAAG